MWGRIGRFFRATAAQQRGMIVLVILLLVLVGAVAVKDGRREIPRVEVLPADSTFERSAFRTDTLFYFDPSSADSSDFVLLGFSPAQARTILRFRAAVGGRFSSPEQFSQCYAVSDSMFARLLPYIRTQELQEEETLRDFSRVDLNRASLKRLRHSTKPWPRNSSRGASATAVLSMPTSCAGSLLPIRQRCDGSPGMRISIRRLWCAMMSIRTANACWPSIRTSPGCLPAASSSTAAGGARCRATILCGD